MGYDLKPETWIDKMLRPRIVKNPQDVLLRKAYSVRSKFVRPSPNTDDGADWNRFRSFFAEKGGRIAVFEKDGDVAGFFAYAWSDWKGKRWFWVPYLFFERETRGSIMLPLMFLRVFARDLLTRETVIAATVYPDAWSFMENTCGVTSKKDGEFPAWMFDHAGMEIEGDRYDPSTGLARMMTVPSYARSGSERYERLNPHWRQGVAVVAIGKTTRLDAASAKEIFMGLWARLTRAEGKRT